MIFFFNAQVNNKIKELEILAFNIYSSGKKETLKKVWYVYIAGVRT